MERILIIQDDPAVHRILQRTLAGSGFHLTSVSDPVAAIEVFRTAAPHIVILVLRLPGKSGPDLCREIRSLSLTVPIFVLSSANDEFEKVLLLELGADDYIAKPFSSRELLARVRVAMRRVNRAWDRSGVVKFGNVEVNFTAMELLHGGRSIPMTAQEFKILRFFVNHEERVVSRRELLDEVWGYCNYPTTRTVDTTYFVCARSWNTIPTVLHTFRPSIVWAISSYADTGLAFSRRVESQSNALSGCT
jgi:DNA-binding response OmpR family regulator